MAKDTSSNTNHKIFGKGRGFPRIYKGRPCTIDAIRVALAGGTRKVGGIIATITQLGWMPEGLSNPTNYFSSVLSAGTRKGMIRRDRVGYYKLKPGDTKPIQWASRNKPELLNEVVVPTDPPEVRRRHSSQITVTGSNGSSQVAKRLCGKMDFCMPGTDRSLFTVKFEIYPSAQ